MSCLKRDLIIITLIFLFAIGIINIINNNKKIKIVLFNENTRILEKNIEQFERENNVEVEIEKMDFYSVLSKMEEKKIFSEKLPDVFMAANDWMGEIVNEGIAEKVKQKDLEDIIPSIREGVRVNKNYYAYPYRLETMFLFYNKNYILNIPKNISELLYLKQKIENETEKYGVIFPTDEIYYHYPWYKYLGGGVNGIATLDKKDIVMKNEIDFIGRNFQYMNRNSVIKKYNNEESLMMINGSWEIEKVMNNKFQTEYGMIKDENFKPFIGFKSFVVYKKSKNKKAAEKLVKFLIDKERQRKFSKDKWHISPNKTVFYSGINKASKELAWCIENPEIMPSNLLIRNNCNTAGELLSRVVKNKEDVEKSILELFGGRK
jgi:maltose-binding protein MalE